MIEVRKFTDAELEIFSKMLPALSIHNELQQLRSVLISAFPQVRGFRTATYADAKREKEELERLRLLELRKAILPLFPKGTAGKQIHAFIVTTSEHVQRYRASHSDRPRVSPRDERTHLLDQFKIQLGAWDQGLKAQGFDFAGIDALRTEISELEAINSAVRSMVERDQKIWNEAREHRHREWRNDPEKGLHLATAEEPTSRAASAGGKSKGGAPATSRPDLVKSLHFGWSRVRSMQKRMGTRDFKPVADLLLKAYGLKPISKYELEQQQKFLKSLRRKTPAK